MPRKTFEIRTACQIAVCCRTDHLFTAILDLVLKGHLTEEIHRAYDLNVQNSRLMM